MLDLSGMVMLFLDEKAKTMSRRVGERELATHEAH